MSELIKLKQAVVVEGKYDKITLNNVVDATIFTTDGFAIFKDRERCELLKRIAERDGIIVMTDSDSAGAQIRAHLKNICAGSDIINVYVPQLRGKERRKTAPSKQGFLGVEGMSVDVIREAILRSGVTECSDKETRKVTKSDLFSLGLSGGENSAYLRDDLLKFLRLPVGISANAFLDAINSVYGYDEFIREVSLWQEQTAD